MPTAFFMKEAVMNAAKNVSLVILKQKQLKDAVDFATSTLLYDEKNTVILVSFTEEASVILKRIPEKSLGRIVVVDASSECEADTKNSVCLTNVGDLTSIQIAIEKAEKKLLGNKVIIFDAVNQLGMHNDKDSIARFFHFFSNKVRLEGKTAIIFATKESIDKQLLELLKEFSDQSYDYSELYISSIELEK